MEPCHAMLAEVNFAGFIAVVVLVIIGAVGSAIKKAERAKEDERAAEQAAARRRQAREAREGEPVREAGSPPLLTKAARRAMAARAIKAAAPPPPARRATLGEGVDDEMADFSRRQEAMQASRQSRLHLAETDAAAPDAQAGLTVPRAGIRLQGSTLAQAIILREILSPPKALRQEQEMWEL